MENFLPVFIQVALAIGLAGVIMVASHLLGQRTRRNFIGDSAYECGMLPIGQSHSRFSVKFYITALLFILLDIETVFLIPLVLVFRDFMSEGIPILLPFLFFILVLVVGLIYEMRRGALDWEK